MGRVRVCGERCHGARSERCACWCGGVFHGRSVVTDAARADFQAAFGHTPKGESLEGRDWLEQYVVAKPESSLGPRARAALAREAIDALEDLKTAIKAAR